MASLTDGHEFEQALGVADGQGSLASCSPWCCKELDTTEKLSTTHVTNLDSVLKSRDITLPTKVHTVTAMIFPVVMNGCESWTIKKTDP